MLMMRRSNMGLSIAASRTKRKALPRLPVSGVTRPGRVSGDGNARADIPGDHAAGADHRPVADGHAGQDNGAAADPDVAADPHRAAEFKAGTTRLGVARVVGPGYCRKMILPPVSVFISCSK